MISNKQVIKELLPPSQSKTNNIVLGRPLQQNHIAEIKNLLDIKEPKKDLILEVFLKASKASKMVKSISQLPTPPDEENKKGLSKKGVDMVKKLMERKYNEAYNKRMVLEEYN